MKEMVGGCCVCSDDRGWTENPLVYCDGPGCSVAVHQACYGIVDVPVGNWYCRKCESQDRTLKRCELCPNKEGALKPTDTNAWAHVICALYIPEVRFGNVTTMEPIVIGHVPQERFNKICYICDEGNKPRPNAGACMQCNKTGCRQQFHVTCAQSMGLLCEEASNHMENVKYCGYCHHHYNKLKKGAHVKAIPPYRPAPPEEESNRDSPPKENEPKPTTKRKLRGSRTPPVDGNSPESSTMPTSPGTSRQGQPQVNTVNPYVPPNQNTSTTPPATSTAASRLNSILVTVPLEMLPATLPPAVAATPSPPLNAQVPTTSASQVQPSSDPSHLPAKRQRSQSSDKSEKGRRWMKRGSSGKPTSPSSQNVQAQQSQASQNQTPQQNPHQPHSVGSASNLNSLDSDRTNNIMMRTMALFFPRSTNSPGENSNSQPSLGESRPRRSASAASASSGPVTVKEEKDVKIFQNGLHAPHMLGNQLNPSSTMAQKMCDTLSQEMVAHSVFTQQETSQSTGLVGPQLIRPNQNNRLGAWTGFNSATNNNNTNPTNNNGTNIPQSLEQLLERQWEQGSQFLMEQAQHFDIASLLSCLHQLRAENAQLEEHVNTLIQRRDHLLAVNARLAIPLVQQQSSQVNNVNNNTAPVVNNSPAVIENGMASPAEQAQYQRNNPQSIPRSNSSGFPGNNPQHQQQNSVVVRAASADQRRSSSAGSNYSNSHNNPGLYSGQQQAPTQNSQVVMRRDVISELHHSMTGGGGGGGNPNNAANGANAGNPTNNSGKTQP